MKSDHRSLASAPFRFCSCFVSADNNTIPGLNLSSDEKQLDKGSCCTCGGIGCVAEDCPHFFFRKQLGSIAHECELVCKEYGYI
jgi:hypothetical protein